MITLTAIKPLTYGPRRYRPGERFAAKPSHAKLLVAVGHARDETQRGGIVELAPQEKAAYVAMDVVTAAELSTGATAEPKRKRRTYRRRDMTAER